MDINKAIPKRLIQIWGGGHAIPILGRASAANLRLLNPEYEYILFDDEHMRSFVDEHFREYRDTFYAFQQPIQRYDFFRYLAIYKLGGFYFDMDMFLASDLSELLKCSCVFPFERLTWTDYLRDRHAMDWEIGNYAFGAVAGHPFLREIITNCVRAQSDSKWRDEVTRSLPRLLQEDLEVIYSTGPGLVSRTLAEYPGAAEQVTVLFPENVCDRACWDLFGDYGTHLGAGGWRKRHGSWRRRVLGFLGRRNEERAIKYARLLGPTRTVGGIRR